MIARMLLATFVVASVANANAQSVAVTAIAPASQSTIQLVSAPRDPSIDAALQRAMNDPYPDASTMQLINSIRQAEDHELQQSFASDVEAALGVDTVKSTVPLEYPPNRFAVPNGFGSIQLFANLVMRAGYPCASIYGVDEIGQGIHGWILICEGKRHAYMIALVKNEWRLGTRSAALKAKKARPTP